MRRLAGATLWTLVSQALSRGSLMLASVVLARSLPPSDFAAYSYFQLTASMIAAYASMGLGASAAQMAARFSRSEADVRSPALGVLWLLSALLALVAFAAVLAFQNLLLAYDVAVAPWLLGLAVAALTMQVVPDSVVLGLEHYRPAAFASAAGGLLVLLGAAVTVGVRDAFWSMLFLVLASAVQTIGGTYVAARTVGWRVLLSSATRYANAMSEIVAISGPMLLVSLLSASASWMVGRTILARPDGLVEFTQYAIGFQWFALALVFPAALSRVLLPRMVRTMRTAGPSSESRRLVRVNLAFAAGIPLIVASVGTAAWPLLVGVYGEAFTSASGGISWYLIAAVFAAPASTVGTALIANGMHRSWLVLTATWWITLLLLVSTPVGQGSTGAGVALTASYGLLACAACGVALKHELL